MFVHAVAFVTGSGSRPGAGVLAAVAESLVLVVVVVAAAAGFANMVVDFAGHGTATVGPRPALSQHLNSVGRD